MQYQETDRLSNSQNAHTTFPNVSIKPSLGSNLQRQQHTVTLLSLLITIVSLFFLLSKISKQDSTLIAFEQIIQTLITDLADYKYKIEALNKHRLANQTLIKQTLTQNMEKAKTQTDEALKTLNLGFTKVKQKINKIVQDQHNIIRQNELHKSTNKPTHQIQSTTQPSSSQQIQPLNNEHRNTQITLSLLQTHQKEQFHQKKIDFIKSMLKQEDMNTQKRQKALLLAQGNLRLPHSNVLIDKQLLTLHTQDEQRLNTLYNTQFYKDELPFCLVVPTYNNAKNFRYEYNLQSILNLDYDNYKVVIIDDASTDYTPQLIQKFLQSQPKQSKFQLILNDVQMTAVPNIHKAITEFCNQNDIVVLIDGDDQLLGTQSLKVFNAIYQSKTAAVVYSNHIRIQWHLSRAGAGWSAPYTANEKKNNMYREVDQKISHLRSFKANLFLKIAEKDMKDDEGQWLRSTYDEVICLPILEMACGKVEYVDQYFYLYNFGIGTNDRMVDGDLQKQVANYVKFKKNKYNCLNQQ